jgi:hypothetical protein
MSHQLVLQRDLILELQLFSSGSFCSALFVCPPSLEDFFLIRLYGDNGVDIVGVLNDVGAYDDVGDYGVVVVIRGGDAVLWWSCPNW